MLKIKDNVMFVVGTLYLLVSMAVGLVGGPGHTSYLLLLCYVEMLLIIVVREWWYHNNVTVSLLFVLGIYCYCAMSKCCYLL